MICIHPYDRTTKFLSAITSTLIKNQSLQFTLLEIGLSKKIHDECLQKVRSSPDGTTIIFLGHGGSDYLLGASGDYAHALIEESAIDDPNLLYHHGHFVNQSNIEVFAGKRVICLSCNSAVELAAMACAAGAQAFVGFTEVPTDKGEFNKMQLILKENEIDIFNQELSLIIRNSLMRGLESNLTFNETVSMIRYWVNVRSRKLILQNRANEGVRTIADAFFTFKNGISVFGDGELTLV